MFLSVLLVEETSRMRGGVSSPKTALKHLLKLVKAGFVDKDGSRVYFSARKLQTSVESIGPPLESGNPMKDLLKAICNAVTGSSDHHNQFPYLY